MALSGVTTKFIKNLVLSRPEYEKTFQALSQVLEKMEAALERRPEEALARGQPRVVSVIPRHVPPSIIIDCYQAGLRHFGESIAHELINKASNQDILDNCPDINWHFHGHIQPSPANSRLVKTPNLYMIESVHNKTVADILDRCVAQERKTGLRVMVQVCSSKEEQQTGVTPHEEAHYLCEHIVEDCPHLQLAGLMINGSPNQSSNNEGQSEFQSLAKTRLDVCRHLQLEVEDFELSMGGCHNYEEAIGLGSSNVRIGPLVFGTELCLPPEKDVEKTCND
jgi:pyridoxal phosphate enzyme (YggS family)